MKKLFAFCFIASLVLPLLAQEQFHPETRARAVRAINYQLPLTESSRPIQVEIVDGYAVFEGDILLAAMGPKEDAAVAASSSNRWTNGIMPYEIESGHPEQANILAAINTINQRTSLKVQPRNGQADYVRFVKGSGCSSYIGKIGGMQPIVIGGCQPGSIQHEILHAAGMYHEQSRSDRDNFVRILSQNIIEGRANNFAKANNTVSTCGYDFGSIMHYPATAFSTNGQPTIQPINALPAGVTMGQRQGLSQCDINGVNKMYPAPFPSPNTYYYIIAKHSGKCLDVDMASMETGGKIVQWDVNGNANQQWKFVPSAQWPGFYTIVAKHSGKSIVPLYGSSDNGSAIVQIEANAAAVYKLVATGGGYYTLVAGHSGKAIDVDMASGANGGKIVQWEVNGNHNQQFILRPVLSN